MADNPDAYMRAHRLDVIFKVAPGGGAVAHVPCRS